MKITFIYAYEGEEWSTPMAIVREFESQGWDIEFVSIGSNRTGQYHDRDIQTWLDSKPKTDIVLFMDWGRFDSPLLDKNLVDAFWVQESGDDPQNFERNFPKSERFHITLSPDSDATEEYKKRGRNAYWWTHFADTRVQYPMDRESEYVAVTSRGIGGSEFLDMLTQHGGGTIGNQNGFNSKEHTEFLNKGLMVIQKSRFGEVTRRIFEGMACGKMVLCDRLNESKKLHELFKEGDEIIFYDDMVDCITKMNKYNEDDTERNRIAKNGYKKVLENHTQKQRVEFIIDRWKNYQSV